jgi:hypothetical protein
LLVAGTFFVQQALTYVLSGAESEIIQHLRRDREHGAEWRARKRLNAPLRSCDDGVARYAPADRASNRGNGGAVAPRPGGTNGNGSAGLSARKERSGGNGRGVASSRQRGATSGFATFFIESSLRKRQQPAGELV